MNLSKIKLLIKRTLLLTREFKNRLFYGKNSPKYAELIWVKPSDVKKAIFGPSNYFWCSGDVIDLSNKFELIDLYTTPRIQSCLEHWVDGVPWENTKDYKVMQAAISRGDIWANCKTENDLKDRFSQLDLLFDEIKTQRYLKARKELSPNTFREEGGILICIGESGEPLLYDGFHRFAISLILNLDFIPAQLGYVDKNSIKYLEKYRSKPANRKTTT